MLLLKKTALVSFCHQSISVSCVFLLPVNLSHVCLFVTSQFQSHVSFCHQSVSVSCVFLASVSLSHVSFCLQSSSVSCVFLSSVNFSFLSLVVITQSQSPVSFCHQSNSLLCLFVTSQPQVSCPSLTSQFQSHVSMSHWSTSWCVLVLPVNLNQCVLVSPINLSVLHPCLTCQPQCRLSVSHQPMSVSCVLAL